MDAARPKVETSIVGWFDWNRGLLENVITGGRAKDVGRQDGEAVPNPKQFKPSGLLLLLKCEAGTGQPSSGTTEQSDVGWTTVLGGF